MAIFSGAPDPQWNITRDNPRYEEVRRLLRSATTYGPENTPGKLGYEGFLVQEVRNGNLQPMVLVVGPETEQLQLLLLRTIPRGMIPTSLKNIVREEIRSGDVSAQFDNTTKRDAPEYDPEIWNQREHIYYNNCYNYALDIMNDCFSHPGINSRRGTRWVRYPSNYSDYCAEAMFGALADGLEAELALDINQMVSPDDPGRHLVALFCHTGQYKLNWNPLIDLAKAKSGAPR